MITDIRVYSRQYMEMVARGQYTIPFDRWHLISIVTSNHETFWSREAFRGTDNIRTLGDMGCVDGISLVFWDLTDDQHQEVVAVRSDAILFSEDQARQIIDFVSRVHSEQENTGLVVHCDAGISRSGAVGVWACDYLGLNYQNFVAHNCVYPNQFVLRMLRRMSGMTPIGTPFWDDDPRIIR